MSRERECVAGDAPGLRAVRRPRLDPGCRLSVAQPRLFGEVLPSQPEPSVDHGLQSFHFLCIFWSELHRNLHPWLAQLR